MVTDLLWDSEAGDFRYMLAQVTHEPFRPNGTYKVQGEGLSAVSVYESAMRPLTAEEVKNHLAK